MEGSGARGEEINQEQLTLYDAPTCFVDPNATGDATDSTADPAPSTHPPPLLGTPPRSRQRGSGPRKRARRRAGVG